MNIVLFIIGLLIAIFSHPKILRPIITRLSNEGVVTQRKISREDAEVIKYAGPNISLFFIGVVLILLSIIL